MKKITFLFVMMFVLVSNVKAQFASSETVYCYKYDHTSNDGIKSKKSNPSYCWVNFQNEMMGLTKDNNLKNIRQRMLENPSYYEDAARNNLANRYSRWKSTPDFAGSAVAPSATIFRYNETYSTYSKYTYQLQAKEVFTNYNLYSPSAYYGKPYWCKWCYTFSSDRSEMIIWSTDDPENREYYKRINTSELKPNTDFLY